MVSGYKNTAGDGSQTIVPEDFKSGSTTQIEPIRPGSGDFSDLNNTNSKAYFDAWTAGELGSAAPQPT